jgi:S-adenosylmethionine decarboxylase
MHKKLPVTAVYEFPPVVGKHALFELNGGNPNLLNDEEFVKSALTEAAKASGATLLSLVSHKFSPQGVTAVALLSESHISLHSWPEYGFASIDCYTCGSHTDPEAACKSLKDAFEATYSSIRLLQREGPKLSELVA